MLEIFLFSFLVALTGALSPGPVMTFTVYKSLREKKGYLSGLFITLGHASLEFLLVILLLLGAQVFFQNQIVLLIIGIVGGTVLVIFGIMTIQGIRSKNYEIDFFQEQEELKGFRGNSFLGGIVVSLSNPFWTFWWAVIGLGFMINFNISFSNPLGLLLFYLGHELGDLVFYVPLSAFTYLGGKSLNPRVYKWVLIICAGFMIFFGVYMVFNIVFFPPY
ncbi:MAG: LysE family transporter [Candidatus Lokiarchaeota archaeon]|nr:LysE family transporter [Candidatus Lokiarchaeota archaeon]